MPMLVQMLIFITGPTNGYYCRYEYPMVVYLPIVIVTGVYLIRHTQKQRISARHNLFPIKTRQPVSVRNSVRILAV